MVPGPTQVVNTNGSSIGAAVFAGLTSVTDRPTDHATRSVRIGRIYVRSTAMRPKNVFNLPLSVHVTRGNDLRLENFGINTIYKSLVLHIGW